MSEGVNDVWKMHVELVYEDVQVKGEGWYVLVYGSFGGGLRWFKRVYR